MEHGGRITEVAANRESEVAQEFRERRYQALTMLAGAAGSKSDFLQSAVSALASGLDVRLAAIGEISTDNSTLHLQALCLNGDFVEPFSIDIADTPCREFYATRDSDPHVYIDGGLSTRYPNIRMFAEIGAESYRAEAFHDGAGERVGHVFVVDDKPMADDEDDTAFFRLVSQRIGAEIIRVRADRERRNSEGFLADLLDHSPTMIAIRDTEGRFKLVNRAYETGLGLTGVDVIGKHMAEVLPEEVAAELLAIDRAVVDIGEPVIHERDIDFAKGIERVLSVRFPIRDVEGEVRAVCVIVTDITEVRRFSANLALQQERYERATAAARVGVWEWDLETDALDFAPNLEEMLGCAEGERIRHIDDWLARVDPGSGDAMIEEARAFRDGERRGDSVVEYSVTLANGLMRWFEARSHPVYDEDGRAVKLVGTDNDITDRKRIESELIAARVAAEKANRTKSEFLATMSHEFRTPLNAILGFSEMMKTRTFDVENIDSLKDYAHCIFFSGEHMLSLVNDMLDIATIEAGRRQFELIELSVDKALGECVRAAETLAAEKDIDLRLDVSNGLPVILVDERSFIQIVNNLVSNAIKFTGRDGKVTVSAYASGTSLSVAVEDTGCGIPADKLRSVSLPFSQVHRDPYVTQQGTGLGLAIVRSLVEAHNGTFHITSEVDKGTRATVTFPLRETASTEKVRTAV